MSWLTPMDPDWAAMELGRWITEARRLGGFSQAGLAARVGVSQSTISRLERGLVPNARLWTVASVIIYLRVEIAAAERTRQAMHRAG